MRSLLLIPLATSIACLNGNPAFDGAATTGGPVGSTGSTTAPTSSGDTTSTAAGPSTSELTGAPETGTSTAALPGSSGETGTSSSGGETSTGETTEDASTGEPPVELPANATLCGQPGGAWKFSAPQPVAGMVNSSAADLDMWLGVTGLTLVWSSTRDGKSDTYRASRKEFGMPFDESPANNVDIGLSTEGDDDKLSLSLVDKRAYLSARLMGTPGFRVYVGDRVGQSYGPLTLVPLEVPDYPDIHDPHVSADDRRLYFAAAGAQDQRLLMATRPGKDEPFGAPSAEAFVHVDVPGIREADPSLPANELVLIFARAGGGVGGSDLWFAARASVDEPFGPPLLLPGVNTVDNEASAHVSSDGCELFFARSPAQDPSAWDIYRSQLLP